MNDPLYADGVDLVVVIVVICKALFIFALLVLAVLIMIVAERKVVADMQNRIGPNRAGPGGYLQSLADGTKLFFKEQSIPDSADQPVFRLAPYLSVLPAFLAFSVIPLGGEFDVPFTDKRTILQLADPPMGVLFVLAMSGVGVYGVLLAGWASGSKYPLLGSVRASAQMVSYEAAIGLGIIGAVLAAETLTTRQIVLNQGFPGANPFDWFLWVAPVPFAIYAVAAVAETNRAPFDLVEAEQELVGGFHTEYTGIRFAMFFLAEYMNMVTQSAIAVTLFLGGPAGPRPGFVPDLAGDVAWFLIKVSGFLFVYIWLRAALPRLRYDHLMDLGWRFLIPIGLIWLGIAAVFQVGRDRGWPEGVYIPSAIAGGGLVYAFLRACMPRRAPIRPAATALTNGRRGAGAGVQGTRRENNDGRRGAGAPRPGGAGVQGTRRENNAGDRP